MRELRQTVQNKGKEISIIKKMKVSEKDFHLFFNVTKRSVLKEGYTYGKVISE